MVIAGADFIRPGSGCCCWWPSVVFSAAQLAAQRRRARALAPAPAAPAARGRIVFEFEMARFARTLGTLLGNGVPLLRAIDIAIETVGNVVLRDSLGACRRP
jgi:type II secretory pathway component PulF